MIIDKQNKLIYEVFWFFIGQATSIVGALVLIRLLTESLTVAMYGELTLVLSVMALVNQLIYGGIAQGVGRFFSISKQENNQIDFFNSSFLIFKKATYILLLLVAFFILFLEALKVYISPILILGCTIYSISTGYNNLFNNIQSSARNRIKVALHAGLDGILKIVFAIIGIQFFGAVDYVVITSFALSSLIVIYSQYKFIKIDYLNQINFTENNNTLSKKNNILRIYFRKIWIFSWPFSAWGLFTWAQISSDRWSLQVFQSTEVVALYAVLFEIGYRPIALIIGLVVNFMTPILFEQGSNIGIKKSNVTNTTRLITLICLVVTILGVCCGLLLHTWIFGLIAASKYAKVSSYLPLMIMAGGLFASGQVLGVKMMSDLNTLKSLPVKVISSIIGVAVNIYGAYNYGLVGVIYGGVIYSIIYFILMLLATREILTKPIILKN